MRPTASLGIFAVLALILVLEFVGAGAYLVATANADPSDLCHGYAVCQ
jgi:hypothetical protein